MAGNRFFIAEDVSKISSQRSGGPADALGDVATVGAAGGINIGGAGAGAVCAMTPAAKNNASHPVAHRARPKPKARVLRLVKCMFMVLYCDREKRLRSLRL
jgi:hypothetical protein